jgi:hypothetical protein
MPGEGAAGAIVAWFFTQKKATMEAAIIWKGFNKRNLKTRLFRGDKRAMTGFMHKKGDPPTPILGNSKASAKTCLQRYDE